MLVTRTVLRHSRPPGAAHLGDGARTSVDSNYTATFGGTYIVPGISNGADLHVAIISYFVVLLNASKSAKMTGTCFTFA